MKIAVGITTTPNRIELFGNTFLKLVENSPKSFSFKIFNDENYEGIAQAKNKCLAMCMETDPDYVIILDDDIYPLVKNWHLPYIESGLHHAMYIFDRDSGQKFSNGTYKEYVLPRGCLLFFTRYCIDTAGGFDERFKGWGYDHAELSRRIFNMELTPAPYIDIPNSTGLFYSHDEHKTCQSSVSNTNRLRGIKNNQALFNETQHSNQFVNYK